MDVQLRRGVTLLLACAGALGCAGASSSTAPPVGSSALVVPPADTGAPATPPPAVRGVTVDASWVAEQPKLTAFLLGLGPACASTESYQQDGTDSSSHFYAVGAPSAPQAALARRFAETARTLGLSVVKNPMGIVQATDTSHHSAAFLDDSLVTVMVELGTSLTTPQVEDLAHRSAMETSRLLAVLAQSSAPRYARLEHLAGGGTSFRVEMDVPQRAGAIVEKWALGAKLVRDGASWMRRYRPEAPDVSVILVGEPKEGKLEIFETRGETQDHPACRPHASRAAAPPDPGLAPDAGTSTTGASDEDLLRQMMGQ